LETLRAYVAGLCACLDIVAGIGDIHLNIALPLRSRHQTASPSFSNWLGIAMPDQEEPAVMKD
jgi:hypothetical protein